jgi:hypothetical protein
MKSTHDRVVKDPNCGAIDQPAKARAVGVLLHLGKPQIESFHESVEAMRFEVRFRCEAPTAGCSSVNQVPKVGPEHPSLRRQIHAHRLRKNLLDVIKADSKTEFQPKAPRVAS